MSSSEEPTIAKESLPWTKITSAGAAIAIAVSGAALGYYIYRQKKKKKSTSENRTKPPVAKVTPQFNGSSMSNGPVERKTTSHALKDAGNELFKKGKFEQAIDKYTEAIEQCAGDEKTDLSTYYQNRAAANEKLNRVEDVIRDCTLAIENQQRYAKAYFRRAKAYKSKGAHVEALNDYQTGCLAEQFCNNSRIEDVERFMQDIAAREVEQIKKARGTFRLPVSVSAFEDVLPSCLDDPILLSVNDVKRTDNMCGYDAARLAIKECRYEDVTKECTRQIEQSSSMQNGHVTETGNEQRVVDVILLETTLLRALFALLEGNWNLATDDFASFFSLINKVPEKQRQKLKRLESTAFVRRAACRLMTEKRVDLAMADFDSAERLDPDNFEIYHNRAQLSMLQQNFDIALSDYRRAYHLHPDFALAKAQLVYVMFVKARTTMDQLGVSKAFEEMEQLIKRDDRSAEVYGLLAQMYLDVSTSRNDGGNNLAYAKELFDKAIALQPKAAKFYVHRGMMEIADEGMEEISMTDVNRAKNFIEKAIEVDPHSMVAYMAIGGILLRAKCFGQAIEYTDRAINLARLDEELTSTVSMKLYCQSLIEAHKQLQ